MGEKKTAEYTQRAINKYQEKMHRVTVLIPPDMEQAIKDKYSDSIKLGTYIKDLINKDLNSSADIRTDIKADTAVADEISDSFKD